MKVGPRPLHTHPYPASFAIHYLQKSKFLSAHSPQLPALSTSCDPLVWSSRLSSSSSSSHPFCTSPSSYCTISSTHSVAWIREDKTEKGRAKERGRWNENNFRQSYSTAWGLISEMYKEATRVCRKCTSDLDDKTSLWYFSALVCTLRQWIKHPSAYISCNEKYVCCEQLKWQSFSWSKLHEGQCVKQAVWRGGGSFLISHSSNLNELWCWKSPEGREDPPSHSIHNSFSPHQTTACRLIMI